MRHLKKGRKFGRVRNQRRALMKALASSFAVSGRMRTTEAKARELRPRIEKFLTRAKTPTLANRRILQTFFSSQAAARMIAHATLMRVRPGGYTRIVKTGSRRRDSAKMAILELVK